MPAGHAGSNGVTTRTQLLRQFAALRALLGANGRHQLRTSKDRDRDHENSSHIYISIFGSSVLCNPALRQLTQINQTVDALRQYVNSFEAVGLGVL